MLVAPVDHCGPNSDGSTAGACSDAQRGPRWLRGMLIVHGTCVHIVWCAPMLPMVCALGEPLGPTPARPAATSCPMMALTRRYFAVCKLDVLLSVNRHGPPQRVDNHRPRGWDGVRATRRCLRAHHDRRWSVAVTAVAFAAGCRAGARGATPLDSKSGGRMDTGRRHPIANGPTDDQVVELHPWIHAGGLVQSPGSRDAPASGDGASEPASSVGARHLALPVDRCALLPTGTTTGSRRPRSAPPAPCRPPPPTKTVLRRPSRRLVPAIDGRRRPHHPAWRHPLRAPCR